MRRLLRIFIFISLVLGGKTNRIEETTSEFQASFQPTTLANELQHKVEHNVTGMMINTSSSLVYNNQNTLHSSFKKFAVSYSNRLFSSTSETSYNNIFNFTTPGQLEALNNNSSNESEINYNNMPRQSPPSTDHLKNFSKQITLALMLPEGEIQNENITLNMKFQNHNITSPVTFEGNKNSMVSPHVKQRVTSLVQNNSTQNSSIIEVENILNISLELSKNVSFSSHLTSYDLDENSKRTKTPETDTEEYLLNTSVTMNMLLKSMETEEDSTITHILYSEPPTTNTIESRFTTHLKNSQINETETFSPTPSTLTTVNFRNSSENSLEATPVSVTIENETLNRIDSLYVTTSTKTNDFLFNSSIENNKDIKQENPMAVNQSSVLKNYVENRTSIHLTQQTIVATEEPKQKEANNFDLEEITISSSPISSNRRLSEDIVQTSSGYSNNENTSLKISRLLLPTVVTQGHHQKEFFFKHINNLTDDQRKNMAIDIIFVSAVDIVEWFHSYDRVFRTTIASLLTDTDKNQSVYPINIIYIAPTPLKNEKYFCITFMVESVFHKSVYEHGETIVQKIKQNISGLAQMLHLSVESVVAGYNKTGKCHKSYQFIQERNWVIMVVLGTILIVAIIVILTMCIQKSRNGKQSWEQDVQEWSVTIHGESGRYQSAHQLPINVQNPSNNIVDSLSRVNQVSSKEENNSFVPNNGVENVLIHNEEKNYPETSCGECNKIFVEDTKL